MIRLTYSNRTEALLDALVRRIGEQRARPDHDPLEPIRIVTPNRNVERFVEIGIARKTGIAANLSFERLSALASRLFGDGSPLLIGRDLLARVLHALSDDEALRGEAMAPVRRYLHGAGDSRDAIDLRRAQLALHVCRLFEQYAFSRPELLADWDRGVLRLGKHHAALESWQRELWRAVRAHPKSASFTTLAEALERGPRVEVGEIHVFGVSYVARIFARLFSELGAHGDTFLYTLNPCEEFWEDLETARELQKRRRSNGAEPEWNDPDPFRLSADTDTPLLRSWGRPGREHIRILGALTDCDFDPAFVDPALLRAGGGSDLPLFSALSQPSLLERLQSDVLSRAPRKRAEPNAIRDDSICILECPSVRRECETVAAEIWSAIESVDDLSFDRIAVLVNGPDRDLYLPHLCAAFDEAHRIPYSVADLSLAAASPLAAAAQRLLALPSTRFTRPDVLAVITHPAVRPADVEPDAWADLCDRLGVYFGIDRAAHEGTYVAEDLFHWEQAITRIALGSFASEGFVEIDGARYLPEKTPEGDRSAAQFAMLVRSLTSDVRFARSASLTLTEWSRFFSAMLSSYLRPEDDRETNALRRLLQVADELAECDLDGAKVSYTLAHELVRDALASLSGARGQDLANGVAIASLLPMRAIPFRAIFVLGLGEGRFPATDRRDSMDLRTAARELGDVTDAERDRYTFLETLLCARDRLVLSYVARDEQTGDPLAPSSVIQELLDVIEEGYLPKARERIVRRPKLRRHEDERMVKIVPEALAELRAAKMGAALREGDAIDLASPAALRRAARIDVVRETLRIPSLPSRERAPSASNTSIRISLSSLRRFLECPLQAWTSTVLHIDQDDPSAKGAIADEPFEPSALDAAIVLRASLLEHAISAADPLLAYAREVEPRKARGHWPIGALAALAADEHAQILARWSHAIAALPAEERFRVRLGSAQSSAASERAIDPITLHWDDDPRAPGSGRPLSVEIVGATELLCASPRTSVIPLVRASGGSRGRANDLRYALRAFFDHAALSAAGLEVDGHRAALIFGDREVEPMRFRMTPLTAETARAWLGDLARDLIARSHAYLFPCEAIFRLEGGWDRMKGEDIVRSIEHVRDVWDGGQSRFGPVRDALDHAPPRPGDAERIAEERFGLVLRSMRREERA
jgi:exodeoxyribonuclease V gamma subunit